ncbi:MAG: efflux RND transporter periplasmic adaptor subunit [Thiotrichales bacterium]
MKNIFTTLLTALLLLPLVSAAESLPCLLEPSEVVDLGSPVTGVIESILVERGDSVNEDQVVAKLTGTVERRTIDLASLRAADAAEVQSAIAAKEHARREKNRALLLFEKSLVSKQFVDKAITEAELAEHKLEQARTNQQQSEIELKLAKAKLDQRIIRSPISGVVTERYAAPGQRIQEKPIMQIVKLHPLKVELVVPAEHFGGLKVGDKMQITPELVDLKARDATVSIVDQVIDAASNTFRVTLELPNTDYSIPAGARCHAEISDGSLAP